MSVQIRSHPAKKTTPKLGDRKMINGVEHVLQPAPAKPQKPGRTSDRQRHEWVAVSLSAA